MKALFLLAITLISISSFSVQHGLAQQTAAAFEAVKKGDLKELESAWSRGDLNPQSLDENGLSLAHLAVLSRKAEILEFLIKKNIPLDIIDKKGSTALHQTLKNKKDVLARLLINAGAPVNAMDNEGITPIMIAVGWEHEETVNLLLSKNVLLTPVSTYGSVLHYAARRNDPRTIKKLIKAGVDINILDKEECTALYEAIYRKNQEAFHTLIDMGTQLNLQDNMGRTALIVAAETNSTYMCKTLLDIDLNPKIKDHAGNTALSFAVWNGNDVLIKALQSRGLTEVSLPKQPKQTLSLSKEKLWALHRAAPLFLQRWKSSTYFSSWGGVAGGDAKQQCLNYLKNNESVQNAEEARNTIRNRIEQLPKQISVAEVNAIADLSEAAFLEKIKQYLNDPEAILRISRIRKYATLLDGKGLRAWYIPQLILFGGTCIEAGLLKEEEVWSLIQPSVEDLKNSYPNFQALSQAQFASAQIVIHSESKRWDIYQNLFMNSEDLNNPWRISP